MDIEMDKQESDLVKRSQVLVDEALDEWNESLEFRDKVRRESDELVAKAENNYLEASKLHNRIVDALNEGLSL